MRTTDQSPVRARAMTSGPTGRVHSLPRSTSRSQAARLCATGSRFSVTAVETRRPRQRSGRTRTRVSKRWVSSAAGSAVRPLCTGPGWTMETGRGEPAEALAERAAGERALGAGLLERGQARPHRVEVGRGVDGEQTRLVQLDPASRVAEGLRVDDHAHVDGLAPLDPRHYPDQRVLKDVGERSRADHLRHDRGALQQVLGVGVRAAVAEPFRRDQRGHLRQQVRGDPRGQRGVGRAEGGGDGRAGRARPQRRGGLGSAVGQLWWKYSAAP